ncbi:uncharacterized protein si:dkeyp-121d4.3 isoform X2 [Brienomyrus brachyistius]|uniref:uncharacterized protein si:dkeyp-121d4.3 isoform X2 n=1 Tax=Brienomyrus brachyistius TaxID=42636 RepID=UPI0020B3FE87|nr:uncharacterized protein si:dkeyp-121d4.3 isoform X2 [Brienomyrus brachyistius]
MISGGHRKRGKFPPGPRPHAPSLLPEQGGPSGPPDPGGFSAGRMTDLNYEPLQGARYGLMRPSSEPSEWGPGSVCRGFRHEMESSFGSPAPQKKGFGTVNHRDTLLLSSFRLGEGEMFSDRPEDAQWWPNEDPRFGQGTESPRTQLSAWKRAAGPNHSSQTEGKIPELPQVKPSETPNPVQPGSARKLPPGRYEGIISFVDKNYGFIERGDLKHIAFSFPAFWGDPSHMIPGVKVQFTLCKEKGKECATDVMVVPGGTEEVHDEVFEGVVTRAPWECKAYEKRTKGPQGYLQAWLFGSQMDLLFGEGDSKVTLLPGDHVRFRLFTDLITKRKRAGHIEPLLETFQFTTETREMTRSSEKQKAIRLKKLSCDKPVMVTEAKENTAEAMDKWKTMVSEVLPQRTVIFEDVSSEQYKGTILIPISKEPPTQQADATSSRSSSEGLLVAGLAGKEKKLPFGPGDVLSETTMVEGDMVQFNICINRGTKAERAVNVEILPDTFHQSNELREMGVVVALKESSGLIQCDRDPFMFFHLSEVMEESKLNVSDNVEFTIFPFQKGHQAVRIKKLHDRVFTTTPKMEDHSAASRDKNKITVKVLRDSAKDEMENLKVKIESFNADVSENDKSPEVDYGAGTERSTETERHGNSNCSNDQRECTGKSWSPARERDWRCSSRHSDSRRRVSKSQHSHSCSGIIDSSRSWNRSHSRERVIHVSKQWDCSYSRSRSHSRERVDDLDKRHHCSRSRSRERIIHASEKWEYSRSRERHTGLARRWSRSPKQENRSHNYGSADDTNGQLSAEGHESASVCNELDEDPAKKQWQQNLLEEQIARRRAIMAMELKGQSQAAQLKSEEDQEFLIDELPSNEHVERKLPMEPETNVHLKTCSVLLPVKSILKKPPGGSLESDVQLKNDAVASDFRLGFDQSCVSQSGHLQSSCKSFYDKYTSSSEQTFDHHQHAQTFHHSSMEQLPSSEDLMCNSLPNQQSQVATKNKSNLSVQIERFLNTLNKGVDANLLSAVVREARVTMAEYEHQSPRQVSQQELFSEDQHQFQYKRKPEIPENERKDFLLPNDSCIPCGKGLTHETWRQEDCPETNVMEGEESQSLENEYSYKNVVDANSSQPVGEEGNTEEGTQQFDKIQNLLQTIGLDLDTSEVSKLADRTRERLYGKKQKLRSSGSTDTKAECTLGLMKQQYSEQDTTSTVESPDWGACGTHPDSLECSGTQGDIPSTVPASQGSGTHSATSPSQYTQGTFKSAYVTQRDLGYSHHEAASHSVWDLVPPQTEADPHLMYPQHQHPGHLPPPVTQAPLLLALSTGNMQSLPTTHIPAMASAALLGPHPRLPSTLSGQLSGNLAPLSNPLLSYYGAHPFTGLPLYPYQSQGNSALASMQHLLGGKLGREKRATGSREMLKSRCLTIIKTVKVNEPTQNEDSKAQKEETETMQVSGYTSTSSPVTSASSEKIQVAKISEDDIKAKQKKRLEQFKERMRLKKEQQREAQRTCVESQKSPTGRTCKEVKNVWICGHALVFWAEKRAKSPAQGVQLGMDPGRVRVCWKGTQGMRWEQFLPLIQQLKDTWPNPDVIIIHLGGNDLGSGDTETLLAAIRKDLEYMKSIFPQCLLVWSSILPRLSWRSLEDTEAAERMRVAVNEKVQEDIRALGGTVVDHEQIRPGSDSGLYRPDGIHLSGKGIDQFNMDIRNLLEKWQCEMSQGSSAC